MSRCGCAGGCQCRIESGNRATVTGVGTPDNPYRIDVDLMLDVEATPTLSLELTGSGTTDDPYILTGTVLGGGGGSAVGAVLYNGPQGLGSGEKGQAQINIGHAYTPEQYGAVGGGTVDDTVAFQTAIDDLNSKGGGVLILNRTKTYRVEGAVLKTGVLLRSSQTGALKNSGATQATLTCSVGYTGWIIDTPSTNVKSCGVSGINVIPPTPTGSGNLYGGIRFQNVTWGLIEACAMTACTIGCISVAGGACTIKDNIVQNFYQYRTLTVEEGAVKISGPDHFIANNQCNAGNSLTVTGGSNFYRCGMLLSGLISSVIVGGNGEYGDVGIKYVNSYLNRHIAPRADINAGHGLMLKVSYENVFVGGSFFGNSCGGDGLYDHINIDSASYGNVFDGTFLGQVPLFPVRVRYGYNDGNTTTTLSPDTSRQFQNRFWNWSGEPTACKNDFINQAAPYMAIREPGSSQVYHRAPARHCNGGTWFDTTTSRPAYSDGVNWRNYTNNRIIGNLLPADVAIPRTSTAQWVQVGGSCTVALVNGNTKFKRFQAVELTAVTPIANAIAAAPVAFGPVVAGNTYSLGLYSFGTTQIGTVSFSVKWFDVSSVQIGATVNTTGAAQTGIGTVTKYNPTALVAPAGAVTATIQVTVTRTGMAAGEKYTFTKVWFVDQTENNATTINDYVEP